MAIDRTNVNSVINMIDILVSSGAIVWSDQDYIISDAMNKLSGNTINIDNISRIEIQKATDLSEVADLTAIQRYSWQLIMNNESLPLKDSTIRSQVAAIWGPGTNTRSNLVDLQTKPSTYIEDATKTEGDRMTHLQVAKIRRIKFGS